MKELIKKYTILVIVSYIIARLLAGIIIIIWPDVLTTKITEFHSIRSDPKHLVRAIEYIINILFLQLIYKEMKQLNLKSIPILILTFFSNSIGVILFLLVVANQKLTNKKTI